MKKKTHHEKTPTIKDQRKENKIAEQYIWLDPIMVLSLR